jgi:Right handed beta helix region
MSAAVRVALALVVVVAGVVGLGTARDVRDQAVTPVDPQRVFKALLTAAQSPRDRYVTPSGDDRGDGSRGRPWRTLAKAARQARPGTTVHVSPGRYAGPLVITTSGTQANPVRFVSDRPGGAVISARSSGPLTVVDVLGSHVVLQGFRITGQGGDGTQGINVEGSWVAILDNRVNDIVIPCRNRGYGGAGILIGGGKLGYHNHDALVAGNLVERVGSDPRRTGGCRLVHGIYAAVPRVTIVNNIVFLAVGDGITSWHAARELTIANNLAADNGGAGILVGSGDDGATRLGNTRTLVTNNIAYRNLQNGITESSDGRHRVGPRNRYLNNLVFGNRYAMYTHDGATVSGTLEVNPQLLSTDGNGSEPFRPADSSPVVNAGTAAGAPRDDYDGASRPKGGAPDIGPYEIG